MKKIQANIIRHNFFLLIILFHAITIIPYLYVYQQYGHSGILSSFNELRFFILSLSASFIYLQYLGKLRKNKFQRYYQLAIVYIFFFLIQNTILLTSAIKIFDEHPNVYKTYFYFAQFFVLVFPCVMIYQKNFYLKQIDSIINFITKSYLYIILFSASFFLKEIFLYQIFYLSYLFIPIFLNYRQKTKYKKLFIVLFIISILIAVFSFYLYYFTFTYNRGTFIRILF